MICIDCGDREQISLELKVYLSLRDVFINDNFHIAYSDIVKRGWFKNGNSFGERINLYGMRGYMSKFYLRDCIVTVYFNIDGKILIIKDISKDRDSSKTKEDILKFIGSNLKLGFITNNYLPLFSGLFTFTLSLLSTRGLVPISFNLFFHVTEGRLRP